MAEAPWLVLPIPTLPWDVCVDPDSPASLDPGMMISHTLWEGQSAVPLSAEPS